MLSLLKKKSNYKLEALDILGKLLSLVNNVNVLDLCNIIYMGDISSLKIFFDEFYESGVPYAIENIYSICYMY